MVLILGGGVRHKGQVVLGCLAETGILVYV